MRLLSILLILIVTSCSSNDKIIGDYNNVNEDAIIESVTFDGTVASFGGFIGKHMPAAKYEVKDNKIYVETTEGILVFEIIDVSTIECKTSIFNGNRFKKQ
jgi:hypothetical protein